MGLSKEMDIIGTETVKLFDQTLLILKAKANVEKECERIEMEFLDKFDKAYREEDHELMNVIHAILFNLDSISLKSYMISTEAFLVFKCTLIKMNSLLNESWN